MPAEQLPALLAALASLQTAAAARLAAATFRNDPHLSSTGLIPVEEAARMAGVTRNQFLRRVAFKPALVRLGHRTRRVNEMRLRQTLAEL